MIPFYETGRRTVLFSAIILVLFFTQSASAVPAKHIDTKSGENTGDIVQQDFPLGYIPPVVYPKTSGVGRIGIASGTSGLPSSYDLRSIHGALSEIEYQDSCGSCWAFSSLAAIESANLPEVNIDLSEMNMKNMAGFEVGCCEGGNKWMAIAYLARWDGAVTETSDPYSTSCLSGQAVACDMWFLQAEVLAEKQGPLGTAHLKEKIMDGGPVETVIHWSPTMFSQMDDSYYYAGTNAPNHTVIIVGWDDDYDSGKFNLQPPGNGAWIAMNSWGTGWGENGFFYISYFDSVVMTENMQFGALDISASYNTNYQYDYYGWTSSYGLGSDSAWMANVFTAEADADLKACAFYVTGPDCSYELYVYLDPESGPVNSAGPVATVSGTISNPGYYTIELPSAVTVTQGQEFSVVCKMTTPGHYTPLPIETPVPSYCSYAEAGPGESWASTDGTNWQDLTTTEPDANVCLKALALSYGDLPPAPGSPTASVTSDYIDWSWQDNSIDEHSFKVYADCGAGPPRTVRAITPADTCLWRYDGLLANTKYSFQVAALNEYGESEKTADMERYTLPLAPSYGTESPVGITPDLPTGTTVYGPLTFTSVEGFGEGPERAAGFGYIWNRSGETPLNWAGEKTWDSGELVIRPSETSGDYYLHIRSKNSDGLSSTSSLTVGPYDMQVNGMNARYLPDWTTVTLEDVVVTCVNAEEDYIYVGEKYLPAGIRVVTPDAASFSVEDVADVAGVVQTSSDGSERIVVATSITLTGDTFAVPSVFLKTRDVGGVALEGLTCGVDGAYGPYNMGLFVKVAGEVTTIGTDGFTLRDYSTDESLFVTLPGGLSGIEPGDFVCACGVVEGKRPEGETKSRRTIRMRSANDLFVCTVN